VTAEYARVVFCEEKLLHTAPAVAAVVIVGKGLIVTVTVVRGGALIQVPLTASA
jgi:hypothetical protein